MRVALQLVLLPSLLSIGGCTALIETSDLSGGTRDAGTCDRELCVTDTTVLKLADIAACTRDTSDKLACRTQIAAACRALDTCCYRGGYGPLEFPNAEQATVLCLTEESYTAPVTELTTASAKCLTSALASRDCDAAAHIAAKRRGNGTSILQSVSGDSATLIGLDEGTIEVLTIPFGDLTTHDPACTALTVDKQACTTAVQRYCANESSSTAGYGPVATTATTATVVCIF